MHPNCAAVNEILQAAGVAGRVRLLDEAVTTARAAAEQLGCPVGAIANFAYLRNFQQGYCRGRRCCRHDQWCASSGHEKGR